MNLKRILSNTILMFMLLTTVAAQENLNLKLDRKPTNSVSDFVNEMRKSALRLDYNATMDFFNPVYFANKEGGGINGGNGFGVAWQQRIWLLRLDVGLFYHGYKTGSNAYVQTYGTDNVSVYGANAFLCYNNLLPDWGKISQILAPYIGIGYQTASLQARKNTGKDGSGIVGSLGIGGLAWKGGLNISIGKHFFVFGEYRQSIEMNSPKAYNALSAGIGFGL